MTAPFPLALLAAFALLLGGPWASSRAAETGPCETCAGIGKAVLPCDYCEGDGKGPCSECANDEDELRKRRKLHVLKRLDPALAQQMSEVFERLDGLLTSGSQLFGRELHPRVPGRVGCVAACMSGTAFMSDNRPCLACGAKGWMACPTCKAKGETVCGRCDGKRTRSVPCPECVGAGRARPATTLGVMDAGECPWCGGTELRDCNACDVKGLRERSCARCNGTGEHPCADCHGTRKTGCNKCSATGDLSNYLAAKTSNRCDKCNVTGLVECTKCQRGVAVCSLCKGASKGLLACDVSTGPERKAPCAGCWDGGTLSWTTVGDRSIAAGRTEAAIAFYEAALEREVASAKSKLEAAGDDAKAKKAIERQLAKRRAELNGKLKAARKTP